MRGAREHNLKNVDVAFPRDRLVVITGLSGSGKSSLAFDTIYAEGQRRYVESLSAYARQFLGQMEKPDVDQIDGLSPAISIDQKGASRNPRSTVGTVTEIYDYLRLLFARIGHPHCPNAAARSSARRSSQIVDQVLALPEGTRLLVLGPLIKDRKTEGDRVFEGARKQGFVRVRVDGEQYDLAEAPTLDKYKRHTIEVVVDRFVVRRAEAPEGGARDDVGRPIDPETGRGDPGPGHVAARRLDRDGAAPRRGRGRHRARRRATTSRRRSRSGATASATAARTTATRSTSSSRGSFSFNSPHGACPTCTGPRDAARDRPGARHPGPVEVHRAGRARAVGQDADRDLVADEDHRGGLRSRTAGASTRRSRTCRRRRSSTCSTRPKDEKVVVRYRHERGENSYVATFEGVVTNLERRYRETESEYIKTELEKFMVPRPCPTCGGKRLRPEVLAVTVDGRNISDVADDVGHGRARLGERRSARRITERERTIACQVLKEIVARLGFLVDVGLDYLTLDRASITPVGRRGAADPARDPDRDDADGRPVHPRRAVDRPPPARQREAHRDADPAARPRQHRPRRRARRGDDPDRRLGHRHRARGGGARRRDHRERAAGGGARRAALDHRRVPARRAAGARSRRSGASGNGKKLVVRAPASTTSGTSTCPFPLGTFIAVTGVSGSGKSTLVDEVLYRALARELNGSREPVGAHDRLDGVQHIDKIIEIDQSPIGRTPRSNPATYVGLFGPIRELFAGTPEARVRGYQPGRFSFNVKGGRCENCKGDGIIKIEMQFLPDVYVPCEVCKGKRYNREALEIHYKGRSIADVLEMTIAEALEFFSAVPERARPSSRRCSTSASATSTSASRRRRCRAARRSA